MYRHIEFLPYHRSFKRHTVPRDERILHHKKTLESSPAVASGLCLHSSLGSPAVISASARVGGLPQAPVTLPHQQPAARSTCEHRVNNSKSVRMVPQRGVQGFNSSLGEKKIPNSAP